MEKERGCMRRNKQETKMERKLTLFFMEHLICSPVVLLTGTWLTLSIGDLLTGFVIRPDFRNGMWVEEEHVTAIDVVVQEEEEEVGPLLVGE